MIIFHLLLYMTHLNLSYILCLIKIINTMIHLVYYHVLLLVFKFNSLFPFSEVKNQYFTKQPPSHGSVKNTTSSSYYSFTPYFEYHYFINLSHSSATSSLINATA